MLNPQKIMVVEDERITAEDIRLRLESWGYSVPAIVDTGEAAIRAAEQLKPDLLLMDIHLKGAMDGVEAARQIRQRRDIPVIYATAHLDSPTLKRAHVTDTFGFINKPYEDREIRSAIELSLLKRQMEHRVAEMEERYRKVVGGVNDLVLMTRRGKILSANVSAERRLGRSPSAWSAITLLELVDPADRSAIGEMLRAAENGASVDPRECHLVHSEGARVRVRVNADRCSYQGEQAVLLIMTESPVGDCAQREVERLVEELVEARADADEVRRLQREQSVELVRVRDAHPVTEEHHRVPVQPEEFDVRSLSDVLVTALAPAASRKSLELIASVHPDVPLRLLGDVRHFRQILSALLENAVRYTQEGEVVLRIAAEPRGSATLRCSVTDTGPGISRQEQELLFYRPEPTEGPFVRAPGKSGLGLVTARQIVEMLGGTIGVESEPGRGSTFWCVIPFVIPEEVPVQPPGAHVLPVGLTALVLDGNQTFRTAMMHQLEEWGVRCVESASLEQARGLLERAEEDGHPFTLVLADSTLPGFDAVDLFRRLEGRRARKPGVVISVDPWVERGRPEGSTGERVIHLSRPVTVFTLRSVIEECAARCADEPMFHLPPLVLRDPFPHRPARVLVVDDEEMARTIIRRMLENIGCMVDEAATGDEAIAAVREGLYDLLLLDCHMEGRDGFSTAAAIRGAEQNGRRLRIVAVTADGDEAGVQRWQQAGMDGRLTKPVQMGALHHLLSTLAE